MSKYLDSAVKIGVTQIKLDTRLLGDRWTDGSGGDTKLQLRLNPPESWPGIETVIPLCHCEPRLVGAWQSQEIVSASSLAITTR